MWTHTEHQTRDFIYLFIYLVVLVFREGSKNKMETDEQLR